jgi:hypothetical protein
MGHLRIQWLAELESSVVGDLDVPRVSGIINIETFQFKGLLQVEMMVLLHFSWQANGGG